MKRLGILLSPLALAACGLQPMYAGGGNGAVAQGLGAVEVPAIEGKAGWLVRNDLQFHWENRGYATFDEFLASLASAKRKNLRKERAAAQAGVEIRALGGSDLFLIHGPTGAGKTTLFDGITYALFGKLAGTRGVDRLRADRAARDLRTKVVFRFAMGAEAWRVERSPEWEREK